MSKLYNLIYSLEPTKYLIKKQKIIIFIPNREFKYIY